MGRLNHLYGPSLTHHDINFLYAIRGSLKLGYYLQTRNTMVRLISCLLESNRNSAGKYVRVSGNWLNGELTSPHQIGWYFLSPIPEHSQILPPSLFLFISMLIVIYLSFNSCTYVFLILLLLSRHLTNSYPIPNCSFQEIPAGYTHYAHPGAQLHPSLGDICALRWVVKGFSPNLRLCALLYKLPRFVECRDGWQPTVLISRYLVA